MKRGEINMVQNFDSLLKEALNLSETDKIHLLSDLFEHIISAEHKEREQLWAEAAERRMEEYVGEF
jgi:hypothetical protein